VTPSTRPFFLCLPGSQHSSDQSPRTAAEDLRQTCLKTARPLEGYAPCGRISTFPSGIRLEARVRVYYAIECELGGDAVGQLSLAGEGQRFGDERPNLVAADEARARPYFVTNTEPASIKSASSIGGSAPDSCP